MTRYLLLIMSIAMIAILIITGVYKLTSEKHRIRGDAYAAFYQIEQRISEGHGDVAYVVSMMQAGADVSIYAVNRKSNIITGASDSSDIGAEAEKLGFGKDMMQLPPQTANIRIKGLSSYCVFTDIDGTTVVYAMPERVFLTSVARNSAMQLCVLVIVSVLLILAVIRYINKHIISSINGINKVLGEIANGDFDKLFRVHESTEFREMSMYLNDMIRVMLANTDKISYILNKTNMDICVYEYNIRHKRVRFTENLPAVLVLSIGEMSHLVSDYRRFREFINELRKHPLLDEEGVYCLPGDEERYLKFDEIVNGNDVFGIIVDVTTEISAIRKKESEMEEDHLTGVLNRRGFYNRFDELFKAPEALKHGLLIMLDADDLKVINDNCGHDKGDIYLKTLAEAVSSFGSKQSVAGRLGGDEFVVLIYGYDSEEEAMAELKRLDQLDRCLKAHLEESVDVSVRFSYGFSAIYGETDYRALMKTADDMMYENKRIRKNDDNI